MESVVKPEPEEHHPSVPVHVPPPPTAPREDDKFMLNSKIIKTEVEQEGAPWDLDSAENTFQNDSKRPETEIRVDFDMRDDCLLSKNLKIEPELEPEPEIEFMNGDARTRLQMPTFEVIPKFKIEREGSGSRSPPSSPSPLTSALAALGRLERRISNNEDSDSSSSSESESDMRMDSGTDSDWSSGYPVIQNQKTDKSKKNKKMPPKPKNKQESHHKLASSSKTKKSHNNPKEKATIDTCHVCQKTFDRRSNFKVHMRKKHKVSLDVVDKCLEKLRKRKSSLDTVDKLTNVKEPKNKEMKMQQGFPLRYLDKDHVAKASTSFKNIVTNLVKNKKKERAVVEPSLDGNSSSDPDEDYQPKFTKPGKAQSGTALNDISADSDESLRSISPVGLFACPKCTLSFPSKHKLKKHMSSHLDPIKKFKCKECDKEFVFLSSLRCHMRNHTSDKPFKCKFCGDRFIKRSYLTRHVKIHTNDRPFKCTKCEMSFTRNDNLTSHLTRYHKLGAGSLKKGKRKEKSNPKPKHGKSITLSSVSTAPSLSSSSINNFPNKPSLWLMCNQCKVYLSSEPLVIEHIRRSHGPFAPSPSVTSLEPNSTTMELDPALFLESRCTKQQLGSCTIKITRLTEKDLLKQKLQSTFKNLFKTVPPVAPTIVSGSSTVTGGTRNDIACGICYEFFSNYNVYMRHKKWHHIEKNSSETEGNRNRINSKPRLTCPHCQKTFNKVSQYKIHLKVHDIMQSTAKPGQDSEVSEPLLKSKNKSSNKKTPKYWWPEDPRLSESTNTNTEKILVDDTITDSSPGANNAMDSIKEQNTMSSSQVISIEEEGTLPCLICDKHFKTSNQLIDHYRIHKNNIPSIPSASKLPIMISASQKQDSQDAKKG